MKTIIARTVEMAEGDILKHIDGAVLDRIKTTDPHPQFSAYVLGHEGESGGDITIKGQRIKGVKKRWLDTAIKSLYETLKIGTKAFHLHAQTSEHEGRRSIGEVVGKVLETIDNKLSAVIINYIEPAARAMGLDIVSMEADIRVDVEGDTVTVSGIDEVTGVAMANSKLNKPGFPGASLLATVQELQEEEKMDIEEIKAWCKENKTHPSEIFSNTLLKEDPIVETLIQKETKKEYAMRRKAEDALDTAKADRQDEIDKLNTDVKTFKGQALSGKVSSEAKKLMEGRKLSETETTFMTDFIKGFSVDDPEKLEVELNTKLDEGVKEYNRLATDVFKIKKDEEKGADLPAGQRASEDDIKESESYKRLSV